MEASESWDSSSKLTTTSLTPNRPEGSTEVSILDCVALVLLALLTISSLFFSLFSAASTTSSSFALIEGDKEPGCSASAEVGAGVRSLLEPEVLLGKEAVTSGLSATSRGATRGLSTSIWLPRLKKLSFVSLES